MTTTFRQSASVPLLPGEDPNVVYPEEEKCPNPNSSTRLTVMCTAPCQHATRAGPKSMLRATCFCTTG